MTNRHRMLVVAVGIAAATGSVSGQSLSVTSMFPARNVISADAYSPIRIDFDEPLNPATVSASSVRAFGRFSGPISGSLQLSNENRTITLVPDRPFSYGEVVSVSLSNQVAAASGGVSLTNGYNYQFWTRTRGNGVLAMENPNFQLPTASLPYGGVAGDFNGDRFADLAVIHEGVTDVRVHLNMADGSGLFTVFLQPPIRITYGASPSDTLDFDDDGKMDLAISMSNGSFAVLGGNGDGTFRNSQTVLVNDDDGAHHGIAAFDANGDGWVDIVRASSEGANGLYLALNNGNGGFAIPTFVASGNRGLAVGDLNNDGIMDLVSGSGPNVHLGNGDGTFTLIANVATESADQVSIGDINGDGFLDVLTPTRWYPGNGDGTLNVLPQVTNGRSATDLGDLDGDGDLDWVVSSYSGRQRMMINDGAGNFTEQLASFLPMDQCAILFDHDNDGDLDITTFNESGNRMSFFRNKTAPPLCDFNTDGNCDVDDLNLMLAEGPVSDGMAVTPGVNDQFDINRDGSISNGDVDVWLADAARANSLGSAYKRGDADLDGTVDGSDFGLWNAHKFSNSLRWDEADFNGDGVVDGSDFGHWNANKFSASDDVVSVPEPSLIGWLVFGVLHARRNFTQRRGARRGRAEPALAF